MVVEVPIPGVAFTVQIVPLESGSGYKMNLLLRGSVVSSTSLVNLQESSIRKGLISVLREAEAYGKVAEPYQDAVVKRIVHELDARMDEIQQQTTVTSSKQIEELEQRVKELEDTVRLLSERLERVEERLQYA